MDKNFNGNTLLRVFLFVLLLSPVFSYGQVEKYTDILDGPDFLADSSVAAFDDKVDSSVWSTIDTVFYAKGMVVFEINPDQVFYLPDTFFCDLTLEIKTYDSTNTIIATTTKDLIIHYDTSRNSPFNNRSVLYFDNVYRIEARYTHIDYQQGNGSIIPPAIFRLSAQVNVLRTYNFDCDSSPTLNSPSHDTIHDRLDISWLPYAGATEYDFEWTFYDDSSLVVKQKHAGYVNLDSMFRFNATRITMKGTSTTIPLIYPEGYVFYRVRGVKILPGFQNLFTEWTSDTSDNYAVKWHEDSLTWQSSISFAEEGKRKEVVSYFDGSLRSRQTVTRINQVDTAVVGETIYDFQGRPAVKALPAPAFDPKIKYYPKFNVDANGDYYSWVNFDTSNCGNTPDFMDSISGASRYYSPSNPLYNKAPYKFIPDAEGYPFSVTEYTQDNTGRISRQSGVGPYLMFNDSVHRETRYYYGKPSQWQLDRLFGNDVGDSSHYAEEMVIDPNGQISITYKDAHDRVIATALAGNPPPNLIQIPEYMPDSNVRTFLRDNNHIEDHSWVSSTSFLARSTGDFTFYYSLFPDFIKEPNCDNDSLCYDCYYDIKISLGSTCSPDPYLNVPLVTKSYKNYQLPRNDSIFYDTLCTSPDSSLLDSFIVNLQPGSYFISRQITISDSALDFYKDRFLRENACNTFETFFENEMAALDSSGCVTCETCMQQLGDTATFLASFFSTWDSIPAGSDTSKALNIYAETYQTCMLLCNPFDICVIKRQMMMGDFTPGSQYAKYNTSASADFQGAEPRPISLDHTSILYWNGSTCKFQDPPDGILPYKDDWGDTIKVNINGIEKTLEQLTPEEFVTLYDPSWASALLKMHPEYCYLKFCEENSGTHEYFNDMILTSTYDAAVDSGYTDPLSSANPDPFFATESGVADTAFMRSRIERYKWIDFDDYYSLPLNPNPDTSCHSRYMSMWDLAILTAIRGVLPAGFSNCDTLDINTLCAGDKNIAWMAFRGMYMKVRDSIFHQLEFTYVRDPGKCDMAKEGGNCCIGSALPQYRPLGHSCDYVIDDTYCCEHYYSKVPRFYYVNPQSPLNWDEYDDAAEWTTEEKLASSCEDICRGHRIYWRRKLLEYCGNIPDSTMDTLLYRFQQICEHGCDVNHPLGASTVPPGDTLSIGSFQEAMEYVLGISSTNPTCNAVLIDVPRPYEKPGKFTVNEIIFPNPPECVCEKFDSLYTLMIIDTAGTTLDSFAVYLAEKYGSQLTVDQLYQIKLHCHDTACKNMTEAIILPQVLSCGDCIPCDSVNNAFDDFKALYADVLASPDINALLNGYFNLRFGFHLNPVDYVQFMVQCNIDTTGVPNLVTCDSIRELFIEYISTAPSQSLDDWMNSVLNLDYSYTDYSMWIYNCAFDTLTLGYFPCDTLIKYRNAFYDSGYPADSFVTWMNDTMYINFNYLQYAAWIANCDSTDSIPYASSLMANRMSHHDNQSSFAASQQGKKQTPVISRSAKKNLTASKSREKIKEEFERALENRNIRLQLKDNHQTKFIDGTVSPQSNTAKDSIGISKNKPVHTSSPTNSLINAKGKPLSYSREFLKLFDPSKVHSGFLRQSTNAIPLNLNTLVASADPYEIASLNFDMVLVEPPPMPAFCTDLSAALSAYNSIAAGFHPPLTLWLNTYLDTNLSYSGWVSAISGCGESLPSYTVECDSLQLHLDTCINQVRMCVIAGCLNSASGLDFTIHEYLQWFDSCGIEIVDCGEINTASAAYNSLDPAIKPPLTVFLHNFFDLNLTYSEWIKLINECGDSIISSTVACDKLSAIYADCAEDYSGSLADCMNEHLGLEFTWREYANWLDSCEISYLDCEKLSAALNNYNSLDSTLRPPLVLWLNHALNLDFSYTTYQVYMENCKLSEPYSEISCDSLLAHFDSCVAQVPLNQVVVCLNDFFDFDFTISEYLLWMDTCEIHFIPCDSIYIAIKDWNVINPSIRPPLITYLNNHFGLSLSYENYMLILSGCNQDYYNGGHDCDSIETLYSFCSQFPPFQEASCLNGLLGLNFTLHDYYQWLDSCSIRYDTTITCELLTAASQEFPCWQDTMTIYEWFNYWFDAQYPDSFYQQGIDTCNLKLLCCDQLKEILTEYQCDSTGYTVYEFLNDVFDVNLTDAFWQTRIDSCALINPCDTCYRLRNTIANFPCQDTISIVQWVNSQTGWSLTDSLFSALLDTCDFEIPCQITCDQIQLALTEFPCDSDTLFNIASWLNNYFGFYYSDSTWLSLLDSCVIQLPCVPECDSLNGIVDQYPCYSTITIFEWLNVQLNLSYTDQEYQYLFDTCGITIHCDSCAYLDSLMGTYTCNDSLSLSEWINTQTGWNLSDTAYIALLDSCNITWDTLCAPNCDSLMALEAGFPCSSGISIADWLNDQLNLSYSQYEWEQIFIDCPVDTMHCICSPLDSLLPLYPCNDSLALYEWLNAQTGWSFSDAQYFALMDSCNITWDTLCIVCDSLHAVEVSYPCNSGIPITTWLNDTLDLSYSDAEWQQIFIDCPVDTMHCICPPLDSLIPLYPCNDSLSLVDWLNSETGWNLSDSMYLFYLDSCKIEWDTLCADCDTLQLLQYSYPCTSSLTVGEWFNQELNLSFTELEWEHILSECRINIACDSCSYLDSLITLYPCTDTLTLSEWLNLQTGWSKTDSQYISMLDSCDLYNLWQAQCDSCEGDFNFTYDSLNCHTVHFYDQSAPTIAVVTYLWYFGDNLGSTSTLENPSFTYSVNDTFDVCLVITHRDSSGNLLCTDSICKPVIIVPTPTVSIAVDSAAFCEGQTHVLVATGSAGVTSYYWNPGGSINDSLNVSTAGTYIVTVSNGYCYASDSQVISLYDTIPPDIIVIGSTNLCAGSTTTDLQVDMDSYNDPASQYLWSTSETTDLITVDTAGTYCVSALDAHGCFVHACQEITESTPPDPPVISPSGILNLCSSDGGGTVDGDSIRCINYTSGLLWSTSETTQSIFVNYEDIFNVTYTDSNGCYSTSNTVSVIINSYTITPDTILSDHPGNISCEGIAVVLTQSGGILASGIYQPYDPAYWAWYTDSCGGTLVDTGSSITVYPVATTTYYVRAEGPCSGGCDSITIIVESCEPCSVLDSLINIYPCNDTLSIAGWLNYQSNQNLTDSAWLALVDSCELDSTWIPLCIPECDSLQILEHSYPCDSSITLAAWLNDTLNLAYTEQEWDSIFVWCPPDTFCGLGFCEIITSLYNEWDSAGTYGPLEVWLNYQLPASFTYWEYVQLLDSCGIYIQIPCDSIDSLIAIYTPLPEPKPYFSLWATDELGLHVPDAEFALMLDSCDTVPPENDCDTLELYSDFFYSHYPANNIYAWLNSTLGYNYSFYQYQLWFDTCIVYWDTCSYFDSLYTYYTSNNITTPVAVWLNQQSGLSNSFWDYVHMLDGCVCFDLPCDTLEYLVNRLDTMPQPIPLFYLYANNYFGLHYTVDCYNAMLDSCPLSPPLANCDSLDSLYQEYLDSIPNPDVTVWFDSILNLTFSFWDYVYWFDSCHIELLLPCDTVTKLFNYYRAHVSPSPAFEDWMNGHLQLHYSYPHYIDMLDTCNITPSPCDSLDWAVAAYLAQPDTSLDFVDYLNAYLGQSLTLEDYQAELAACHNDTNFVLCDNGVVEPTPDSLIAENCLDDFINLAYTNAQHSYQLYMDSISGTFVDKYVNHCLKSFSEDFYMDGPFSEYHYTLYYYDQAGNLAQTIPPNGAIPFRDPAILEEIGEFRKDPYGAATPHYQNSPYATIYNYNTLNKPVGQRTPDADSSHFWYDRVGRLIFSQNAQQYIDAAFSYSIYDDLGRIIEVGKLTNMPFNNMQDDWARDTALVRNWIEVSTRSEVTHTYYDVPVFNPSPGFTQENLRNRVASVTHELSDDNDSLTYNVATHYTYDISGNVNSIIQENKFVESIGQSLKRIDYDYDLVSGKVNYVYYQKDSVDQFIHHYEYDDDNRITHVYTSRDAMLWDEDAHYKYYLHGPLARVELGQQKVQGVDYAYTIQGWMKGINASILDTTRDMGNDGTWPPSGFSRDAYGFSLGYFYQDYKQIDPSNSFQADYTADGSGSTFGTASFGSTTSLGLYNGNIRHSVLSMDSMNYPNIGYVYQYDQLNRLKEMNAYAGLVTDSNDWNTDPVLDDYKELIDFDPNGNILNYLRRGTVTGTNPLDMDSMTYNYSAGKNQLEFVKDNISDGNYANDIDDQSPGNYVYDANGNLIEDVSEGLTMRWWNSGKLLSVDNSISGDALTFVYDCSGNRIIKDYRNGSTGIETTTFYIRDAQGNLMATYDLSDWDTMRLKEFDIYGSSRIGMLTEDTVVSCASCTPASSTGSASLYTGKKLYELTNHLGNVLSTITDKKIYYDANSDSTADYSTPEITSQQDYYPFGMAMPGRSLSLGNYRFGFNNQERTDEVSGIGNHNTALFWEFDTRLGRRWNLDPKSHPSISYYSTFSDNPIWFEDRLGDTTYNFNMKDKKFLGITDLDKSGSTGALIGPKGRAIPFAFQDPAHDPGAILNGKITEFEFVTNEKIASDLKKSGALDATNNGKINGAKYLLNHSDAARNDGKTDFTINSEIVTGENKVGVKGLPGNKLFITVSGDQLIAQNNYNFGNFLWGAAAGSLGVPLWIAKIGAHVNNSLTNPENIGKKLYQMKIIYDSDDDQNSISLGYQKSILLNKK